MRRGSSLFAIGLVALLVAAVPAQAASPAGGTLSKTKKVLRWTGGPYDLEIPMPDPSIACVDDRCDHFALKVNMGQGARVKIAIQGSRSGLESLQNAGGQAVAPNDFDLYLYDPNGDEVATSATPNIDEGLTFTHKAKFRNKPYDVVVDPWLIIPGASYKGTITIAKFVK